MPEWKKVLEAIKAGEPIHEPTHHANDPQPYEGKRKQIALMESIHSTSSSKHYEVIRFTDGTSFCNCPGWMFQKIPAEQRECKHTRQVQLA